MAHYAKVEEGIVTDIQVIPNYETDGVEDLEAQEAHILQMFPDTTWIKCSYNTYHNAHLLDGTPLRGNHAGVGSIYDADNDVFYREQPYSSWTLDTSTWDWVAPVAMPVDATNDGSNNSGTSYGWDEDNLQWVALEKEYPEIVTEGP